MDITNITNFVVRNDTLNAFINAINKGTVPTAEEEKELFVKYEGYVDDEHLCDEILASYKNDQASANYIASIRERAEKDRQMQIEVRNEILFRNMRFVYAVAKRYSTDDILPDLINTGIIGMVEAFEKYNWREGNRFTTLAIWYIRRAINAYLNKENLVVRPKNGARIIPKVKKIENDFFLKNGRKPFASEVMEILKNDFGIEVDSEIDIYGTRVDKIEQHLDGDDDNTLDKSSVFNEKTAVSNGYDEQCENDSVKYALNESLKVLDDRERTIICMAYGYGYNREYKDKEIGEAIGITSERVRQLRHGALKKLRSAYLAAEER